MRLSLIVLIISLFCIVAIVQSAVTQKRPTAAVKTTKAPARQSAYAYLRSVRGNRSCTTGTCPFWERHGRSFAALRCYSQQYQECVCLHRMCFSSCMFSREVCNQEMVSCLRQICPRCMPPSSLPMCSVYDSMAERVADALSVFACYPCCPMMPTQSANTTSMAGLTTTTPPAAAMTETPALLTSTTPIIPLTDSITTTAAIEGQFPPTTGVDGTGAVLPAAEASNAAAAAAPAAGPAPNRNQRVQTVRTTKRTLTTRRLTTRRPVSTAKTNQVKNIPQTNVKATKKPQSSVRPKS